VYETAPWGVADQPDFLNAVVIAEDGRARPFDWLARAHAFEQAAGRVRETRWGPRTLDVDVIDVELTRRQDPQLTLPHPRAHQRAFVLVPWLDVAPDAVLAGHGRVADLVGALPAAERRSVRRREDLVLR
jgi:2-amino-4-hydroxy-6-hydroxymethyldihydropteridine diphosphokinase